MHKASSSVVKFLMCAIASLAIINVYVHAETSSTTNSATDSVTKQQAKTDKKTSNKKSDEKKLDENSVFAKQVESKLKEDKILKKFTFTVEGHQGMIEVNGTVDNEHQKQRAIEIAQHTHGVRSVTDGVEVKGKK